MKFSIKDFYSECFLQIWSHVLKKSLIEFFIFCAVRTHFLKRSNKNISHKKNRKLKYSTIFFVA